MKKSLSLSFLFKTIPPLTVLPVLVLFAQNNGSKMDSIKNKLQAIHLEKYDKTEPPALKKNSLTSPSYIYKSDEVFTIQVNVDEEGMNIVNDAANEPSMAINPLNRDQLLIGWRQFDDISNNFRQAGNAYSTDGGLTWNYSPPIDESVFRSDPVLDYDSQGNFYYNSLSHDENGDFVCHIFVSTDGGADWESKLYAYGGDKQWMTIDKSSGPSNGHIYEMWTYVYGLCNPMSLVRSTDKGITFDECVMVPEQLYWGTLTVNRTGDLFLGGINSLSWRESNVTFVVAKSSSAKDSSSLVTWDYSTRVNLDGSLGYGYGEETAPNPNGLLGQTWIATDTSGGEFDGNLYLLASVQRASVNDPLDVMFSRSTDDGVTWIDPVRVNDDLGLDAWQWFGTIAVAPTGRIDVAWLDTRDDPDSSFISALYYAYSTDAGDTWSANIKLSDLFNPHVGWPNQNKMGDYFHMISDEQGASLAWANTLNGEQDIYYSRITVPVVEVKDSKPVPLAGDFKLFQNYPNPFNPSTTISYRIPETSHIRLKVFSGLGEEIAVLVDKVKQRGIHTVSFNAEGLSSGVYFYTLFTNKFNETKKLVLLQ